jgi:hypothetical protein
MALANALIHCPDHLWETDLWPDEASTGTAPDGRTHGSAPWLLAHHALLVLEYDLSGGYEPWEPPPPFDESTWAAFPNRVFTKPSCSAGSTCSDARARPWIGSPLRWRLARCPTGSVTQARRLS